MINIKCPICGEKFAPIDGAKPDYKFLSHIADCADGPEQFHWAARECWNAIDVQLRKFYEAEFERLNPKEVN